MNPETHISGQGQQVIRKLYEHVIDLILLFFVGRKTMVAYSVCCLSYSQMIGCVLCE